MGRCRALMITSAAAAGAWMGADPLGPAEPVPPVTSGSAGRGDDVAPLRTVMRDHLAGRIANRPILIASAYRSDELYSSVPLRELRSRLLGQRLAEEIRLPRLRLDQTATMTSATLGRAVPAQLVTAVHERTDGIPLHIEEFLAAIDENTLVEAGLTNRQIAEQLVVAPKTISAHITHILTRRRLTPGDPRAADTAALHSGLTRLLSVDQSPAAAIVAATEGPILVSNQWEVPPVPNWHRDRMIIIGDAAHAVSPATGQGAPLACEDAVTLARHLRESDDIPAAFAGYETDRRERVHRVTEMGAMMGGTQALDPFGRVVRDLFLPRILGHISAAEMMAEMSWLYEHRIDWPADRRP